MNGVRPELSPADVSPADGDAAIAQEEDKLATPAKEPEATDAIVEGETEGAAAEPVDEAAVVDEATEAPASARVLARHASHVMSPCPCLYGRSPMRRVRRGAEQTWKGRPRRL